MRLEFKRGQIEIRSYWHMAGPTQSGTLYSEKAERTPEHSLRNRKKWRVPIARCGVKREVIREAFPQKGLW